MFKNHLKYWHALKFMPNHTCENSLNSICVILIDGYFHDLKLTNLPYMCVCVINSSFLNKRKDKRNSHHFVFLPSKLSQTYFEFL